MTNKNKLIEGSDLVSTLSNFYDFNDTITCQFIRRSFNDHYIVKLGKEKYILRVYLNNKSYIHSIDYIYFELDLLDFLYQENLPVISPILNKYNQHLSVLESNNDTRYLVLFPFAKGTQIDGNLDKYQSMRLGKLLAHLHLTSNKFKTPYFRYRLDREHLILEPLQSIEKHMSSFDLGNLSFFKKYSKRLLDGFNSLAMDENSYGIIHGDPNPSNFFYDEESGFSLFDFDHCGYGFRIHDLAVIKLSFPDSVYESIIEGYQSIRRLLDSERNNIELYSEILQIKKFNDIYHMLEITHANESEKKLVTQNAYRTLKSLTQRI